MIAHHLIPSREAEWTGLERVWSTVQQYPPKRDRSSWWLVGIGAGLVLCATIVGLC